jgi:hypothetical protein
VPGTRQSPAFGKNRPLPSAGHSAAKVVDVTVSTCRHPLPSAAPLGTRQRIFYFFLKFLCRLPPNLAPGKEIFYFFKNFFAGCPLTWHPAKASLPGARVAPDKFFFCFFAPFFCGALLH